eukprot:1860073-Prymnesium_polylepis.1
MPRGRVNVERKRAGSGQVTPQRGPESESIRALRPNLACPGLGTWPAHACADGRGIAYGAPPSHDRSMRPNTHY